MGKVYVKGGTPVGSESLCRTCSYAQIMTGYRESELMTICDNPQPAIVVPFNIYECTRYYDKNRPSWEDMKKLAINVASTPLKPVGFKVGIGFREAAVTVSEPDEDDFDEDDE